MINNLGKQDLFFPSPSSLHIFHKFPVTLFDFGSRIDSPWHSKLLAKRTSKNTNKRSITYSPQDSNSCSSKYFPLVASNTTQRLQVYFDYKLALSRRNFNPRESTRFDPAVTILIVRAPLTISADILRIMAFWILFVTFTAIMTGFYRS